MSVLEATLRYQLEDAESSYLFERVSLLKDITGNKYSVETFEQDGHRGFIVGTNPSPMNCRLCGIYDLEKIPPFMLERFYDSKQPVYMPVIGTIKSLREQLNEINAEPLRGWTHGQFYAHINSIHLNQNQEVLKTRPLSSAEMDTFLKIHSSGFTSSGNSYHLAFEMFKGLVERGRGEAYVVEEDNMPIAIGFVYFSDNDIAYLATAATTRSHRKKGAHEALLLCRIQSAQARGMKYVSATALLNSQSRRNLEKIGLTLSHTQMLLKCKAI